ncbi:amino acid dehydrogenase [Neptuniibacter sp.]|uniref:Leu/Phe/Val dehydrogenase n=1 Tax=Neptuniibacter sp. TaxID=1962643 RepID=UPI00260CF49A|nr:amino acid dehydrogenase [Neptuniibacter sp.]MCP4598305.1 amino acid dehydrogenase [Neptuniibacter sp.]
MFQQMESNGTQRLHFFSDPETGLKAIIAIHSTVRGPAIGGCRFISYQQEDNAVIDALRLARGMSYKAALAGLPHGGGKAVIIKPENHFNRPALFQAFGRFVNTLNGDYITAMDSGTQVSDMDQINKTTNWVTCTNSIGDPSPMTALGVFEGIKAAVRFKLGRHSLNGIHISLQGLGHVGYEVARLLHQTGAKLTVADINQERALLCEKNFSAQVVEPDDIYAIDADLFCPCGLGAIINDQTIDQFKVSMIAGSANNQLAEEHHGEILAQKGILYAPDFLINAGGLIFVALQYSAQPQAAIRSKVMQISDALKNLFQESSMTGIAVNRIANKKAEEIISAAESMNSAA